MTRFWLIRHALVAENARAVLYGTMDVELCPHTLEAELPSYQAIARHLPKPAAWVVTPLSRTRRTAEAIFAAGYGRACRTPTCRRGSPCRRIRSGRTPAPKSLPAAKAWSR